MIAIVGATGKLGSRVCHVLSGDTWGGAETQALTLMQELVPYAHVEAIVLNSGVLQQRLASLRIPVQVLDEKSHGPLQLMLRLYAAFRQIHPDLVHVHGFKENTLAGLAARLLRIPVVRTHHGRGLIGKGARYTLVEKINARLLSDRQISVSDDLLRFLKGNGISTGNSRIIRNGIAIRRRSEHRLPYQELKSVQLRIGTIGRLVQVKNQACLLEAFRLVTNELPHASLAIVGEGPLEEELKSHARLLGIADKVKFLGFREDVYETLDNMDIFVLTSHHEGIPISLLEAMNAAVPVICSRVGGVPEVVQDGVNGMLVAPNDALACARAIFRIANDPELSTTLSLNARSAIERELSIAYCLKRTRDLYADVLGVQTQFQSDGERSS